MGVGITIIPKQKGGNGGTGGDSPVKSVNGKIGHIFLTATDLNAIMNLQASVGGIMVGQMKDLPITPKNNTIFISTDRVPNAMYLYNKTKWEKLSGGNENVELEAIAIKFDNSSVTSKATNVQKALEDAFYEIKINKDDYTVKIKDLNTKVDNIVGSDGKIRLTIGSNLNYLSETIDKSTLDIKNDILSVKSLAGLLASIEELNKLKGIKDNVQTQLDQLKNVGGLVTTVPDYAHLLSLDTSKLEVNDLVIVTKDENNKDQSTIYMLNKDRTWELISKFEINIEVRDFTKEPINLVTEITGILQEKNIDSKLVRREELVELIPQSTDDLLEGNVNKYFTEERANQVVENNTKVKTAFNRSHTHSNMGVIAEIGEDKDGKLTFRGLPITSGEGGEIIYVEGDGRVKLNALDVLGFLENKLDNITIGAENNKLTVYGIKDLIATVDELNKLQGIESNVQNQLNKNLGLVKLNKSDVANYLTQKLDNDTIKVYDNKIIANKLNGQTVSIAEINYLLGAKGNIQEQIDMLSQIGNFRGVVDKVADLSSINKPIHGDMVIVSEDNSFYVYSNGSWTQAGKLNIEIRNFETNPIDLSKEVTGVLDESKIDNRIARKTDLDSIRIDSTSDLPEGSNKYYTEDRVSNNINVKENTNARHTHNNKEVLDALSINEEGHLKLNGKDIATVGEINWEEF